MSTKSAGDNPKRVGVWIRVSTEDQVRGESPEHHEKRARYYAESRGWEVVEVFRLDAVSGKAVIAHPEAQRMLAHIKAGTISGLGRAAINPSGGMPIPISANRFVSSSSETNPVAERPSRRFSRTVMLGTSVKCW